MHGAAVSDDIATEWGSPLPLPDPFATVATIHPSARIHPTASIGAPGEDRRRPNPPNHGVEIAEAVTVREFATVHGGFDAPTTIGAGSMVMTKAHVGHDCELGAAVTICAGAVLGGHTHVHTRATVAINAVTHPRITVGAYAYVAAGAVVIRDVPPFVTVAGVPARAIGWNRVGMQRAGMSEAVIDEICSGEATVFHAQWEQERGRHK